MRHFILLLVLTALKPTSAYKYTETFGEIYLAHTSPSALCPTPSSGLRYYPDDSHILCCGTGALSSTKTTGTDRYGQTVYACCMEQATCQGYAQYMSDWSLDTMGDIHDIELATPLGPNIGPTTPAPNPAVTTTSATPAPNPTVTTTFTTPSLGTSSLPGATPYSTAPNGVVFYNYNNPNNNISINTGTGDTLSGGAIAGISLACAIIGTILAALGVYYARKQTRKHRVAAEVESAAKPEPQVDAHAQSYTPSTIQSTYQPYERVEREGQATWR